MTIRVYHHFPEPLTIEAAPSAVLTGINQKLDRVMSLISEFAAKMDAHNQKIDTAVSGLVDDVAKLEATIKELQEAPGEDTPANKALLDAIESRTATIAEKLTALDAQRPPAVPPEAVE